MRATVQTGNFPGHIAVAPSGNPIFVTNRTSGTVSVIDSGSLAVTNQIDVGKYPWYICLSTDGHIAYVTNINSSKMTMFSTAWLGILDTVHVGNGPWAVVSNPDPSIDEVYLTNSVDATVMVLSGDGHLERTVSIGTNTNPYEAAISMPYFKSLLVPNFGAGTLLFYDIKPSGSITRRPTGSITLGGTPTAVTSIPLAGT